MDHAGRTTPSPLLVVYQTILPINASIHISHFIVGLLILFYDCGFVVVAVVCFGVAIESSFYIIKSINLFGLV